VADDRRLPVQPSDDLLEVIGDLADRLAGERMRMGLGLLDRLRVVRPPGCHCHVAALLEEGRPAVPAVRKQPQPVDEDDRWLAGDVRLLALLQLVRRDGRGALGNVGSGRAHGCIPGASAVVEPTPQQRHRPVKGCWGWR
jgi:hypothetical protein